METDFNNLESMRRQQKNTGCTCRPDHRGNAQSVQQSPAPPRPSAGERGGRREGSWRYCRRGRLPAAWLTMVTLLTAVDLNLGQRQSGQPLSELERLVVRGRCQARCNHLFGYQERETQIDLFDHYLPFLCPPANDVTCEQCIKACGQDMKDKDVCSQSCESSVCRSSCDFLHLAFVQETHEAGQPSVPAEDLPPAAASLTVTKPTPSCTYTTVSFLSSNPKSLVRLYWNVRDVTNTSTSVALSFVLAIRRCGQDGDGGGDQELNCSSSQSSPWTYFNKTTNYSVIPVRDLQPNTTYIFKVLAVHWSGFIQNSVESEPITTPPVGDKLDSPVQLVVREQYVRAGGLHALVSWKPPPVSGGCFFRLYWMPPPPVPFERVDIQYWAEPKYELRQLSFNAVYTVELYNSDEQSIFFSAETRIQFSTLPSCLAATNHDYNLCPPEKPSDVVLTRSAPYLSNVKEEMCDIYVTWGPAKYIRHRNVISNYSLSFRKAPDMHNANLIRPHRATYILPASSTSHTIERCDCNGVYEVTLRVHSAGGRSDPATATILLGSGYADSFDTNEPVEEDRSVLYAASVPVVLGILAVGVCALYHWRNRRRGKDRDDIHKEEINPLYNVASGGEEKEERVDDQYEIDFKALRVLHTIGEGAFGRVVKAQLDLTTVPALLQSTAEDTSGSQTVTVAVKMLKEHATPDERKNLLLEIEAMKQLGYHQNIVSLLACVTWPKRPCLVMHYCPLGDLRNFLCKHRKQMSQECSTNTTSTPGGTGQRNSEDSGISDATHNTRQPGNSEQLSLSADNVLPNGIEGASAPSATADNSASTGFDLHTCDNKAPLSQIRLLSFARQIAMGMEYLAERKFIHRDLAARNVLLYNQRQLKISDFGLARNVHDSSVYQPTSARKLPYKWMPVESIFHQVFTSKSDVWSFGIVLWEIITLGGCPYPGIPNQDLFRLLKKGYRMEKPLNCSSEIYNMMLSCWHPDPEDRPSFTQLRLSLEETLEKKQPYIDLSINVSEDYYRHDSDDSCDDCSVPLRSSRQSEEAGAAAEGRPDDASTSSAPDPDVPHESRDRRTVTAAEMHVRQLFHNNNSSSHTSLVYNEADSVSVPSLETGVAQESSPSPPLNEVGGEADRPGTQTPDSCSVGDSQVTEDRPSEPSSSGPAQALSVGELRTEDGVVGDGDGGGDVGEEDEEEDDDVRSNQEPVSSAAPLLAPTPCSGPGSSITDLTGDDDSADNASDTSRTSSRCGHQVKVQHAPSLTYGILSFLRGPDQQAGLSDKIQARHSRQSRSLTDMRVLDMEAKGSERDRDLAFAHTSVVHL